MLKQFNVDKKVFADPIILINEQGESTLTTSGEGWYAVNTQEEINQISASITGDGEVWVEEEQIHCSGRRPSEVYHWDSQTKSWQTLTVEQQQQHQAELLRQQKAQLMTLLADKTDQLKAQILAGYSQAEIDSFYRQEREAREWKTNNQAPTPMLSQIVESRPEVPSLAVLVEKVIEKADAFSAVMGAIIGKKQAIETRIELAKNNEELTACEQEINEWQRANH